MRARPGAVAAALVVLSACTSGDGFRGGPATTAPTVTSTAPPITATTPTTAVAVTDPAGAVTLRVTAFTLPDLRAGGTGLRLVVRPTDPRLTVRRRGGGGAVSACPVTAATTPVVPADCVDLAPNAAVELGSAGGVELRATGPSAGIDEVAVTYVAATRSTTVVTPARPAGACATRACETTFTLRPGRAGPFTLDGRPAGGRPRLILTAVPLAGSSASNRMLATVEGGGSLSIRATLNTTEEASLLHQEQSADAVTPLTAEILWP